MKGEKDYSLKLAQIGFSIGGIGPLRDITRPYESKWMFQYYEKKLIARLKGVKDQEKYKSFTETFAGDEHIDGLSARYNRKVEISSGENNSRILVWSTINDNPLVEMTGLSFVRIVFANDHIQNVEFYGAKIPKNKLQGSITPDYHEVPELNKWYFLEMMNRELADISLEPHDAE